MEHFVNFLPYTLPLVSAISLFVGLAALGFDVIKILKLSNLRNPLQLISGAIGIAVILGNQGNGFGPLLPNAAILICIVTSISLGLAALGFDIVKILKLSNLRKPLQYIVGIAGLYALLLQYGIVSCV